MEINREIKDKLRERDGLWFCVCVWERGVHREEEEEEEREKCVSKACESERAFPR